MSYLTYSLHSSTNTYKIMTTVSFYLLEIVPVTVIKKNCFGKIFAYKTHPNFGGNF